MADEAGAAPPDALDARLEKALRGQYRILRLLGRGGMGAVYLAREEALERLVAVKVLAGALDAEARERFRREARNGARLTHAGIVPLYAFGEAGGIPYLVMGYVRGETLSARLRREGRLGAGDARRILADVAEALDHAHRHGIVHRDVKPDNIMIDDESGRALLTDFGVAKAAASGQTMTQAGSLVGTPQFMSPEQVAGAADVDGRSDLYALGLTAYEMLSGRLPFRGGSAPEVLLRRLSQDAPPLRQAAAGVPDDLDAAVMRCLVREPQGRWPDARAFRDAVAPVSLEEDQLPEPLDAVDGTAAFLLPFVLLCAFGAWGLWCHSLWVEQGGVRHLQLAVDRASAVFLVVGTAVIALQVPTLLTVHRLARRRGFTGALVAIALCRQPRWWLCLWYPRRFRRPGDVWDRLPPPFRVWRVLASLLVAAALPLMAVTMFVASPRLAEGGPLRDAAAPALLVCWVVTLALALAAALSRIACARMLRRRGYDTYTLRRLARALLVGPTADRTVWKQPELSRLLLPARRSGPPEPRSPSEYLSALSRAVGRLSGSPTSWAWRRWGWDGGCRRRRSRSTVRWPGWAARWIRPRSPAWRRAWPARPWRRAKARTSGRCGGSCRTSATCCCASSSPGGRPGAA